MFPRSTYLVFIHELMDTVSALKRREMSFSPRVESSSGNNVKRIAVVGRGMIGCSIFKYLSKTVAGGSTNVSLKYTVLVPMSIRLMIRLMFMLHGMMKVE